MPTEGFIVNIFKRKRKKKKEGQKHHSDLKEFFFFWNIKNKKGIRRRWRNGGCYTNKLVVAGLIDEHMHAQRRAKCSDFIEVHKTNRIGQRCPIDGPAPPKRNTVILSALASDVHIYQIIS